MGNDFSKGVDSAVSIITGIITGDMTGGLAGASAPWLAEQIKLHTGHMGEDGKWQTDDIAGNLIAHAILGAVVAELQGNSGLAGGAGAVAGEVAADIIRKQLYGKEVKDLTEEEKQTISALSQLASGLAVAAGGGNIGDASAAINSSKNAVENNYLSVYEAKRKKDLEFKLKTGSLTEQEMIELLSIYEKDKITNEEIEQACVDLISNRCLSLLDEARRTKKEYEEWRGGSSTFYQYLHYFLNDYKNISALFEGREYENIIYEQDIRNLISDNPNMSREEAEFILYEQAKRGYEAINNKYSKTQELINSFAIAYWAVYGTKASMSEALENRMKFYESKYGKKVDETTGKQIEIDTGSNNKQAGVDANRVKDNIDASGKARESSNFREHVVNEKGLENAGKGTTSTESKVGEYLEDFKPSPTPTDLVQQQAGKDTQVTINTDHILNGEIKTYRDGTKVGTGGHYLKDPNIQVYKWTGEADANGVTKGYIKVRDPATGNWYKKKGETTFFPKHWSKRQTEMEIKSAFENSKRIPNTEMWEGTSSRGLKMQGFYKKPDGTGATAWPIYGKK